VNAVDVAWAALGQASRATPRWTWPEPHPKGHAEGLIHGASAGEVKAAHSLLPVLRERTPDWGWTLSSGTQAGIAGGAGVRLPRDASWALRAFLDRLAPRALLLVEAELWPALLGECARRGLPVGVVGARVSPAAARRLALGGSAVRRWLDGVGAFAAASDDDAERIVRLGVRPERVRNCGWIKWPSEGHGPTRGAAAESSAEARRNELPAMFPLVSQGLPLLVLGSVHAAEAIQVSRALQRTPLEPGRARWLLVPRHERDVPRIRREARLLAEGGRGAAAAVAVDGRFGVLPSWYAVADAIWVGGGAAGRGVHDLLEPLVAGLRPLCHLERGDPAGVGRELAALGLALPLDGTGARALPAVPPASDSARLALARVPNAWATLRARRDGRQAAVSFLAERGILP
jgi:3-deoxy-D-manno-octulosonic-acid transferase